MALPSLRDFTNSVRAGFNNSQSAVDAGVAGLARAAGYQDIAHDWERSADEQALEAQRYANPATKIAPWREGGGGWGNAAPWLVDQAGQLIGGAAPLVAGGVAGMAAAPFVPEALGGAALASGLGMGIASYPQAVGANYQAERDANAAQGLGEVTPEQAQSAAAWGVPSAALNAFAPTRAVGIGETAANAVSRTMLDAAKGVAKTGVDNALATAGQKAIEHSFRPDMSAADKTRDMLDSVVTGFIGGVGMGAAGEGVGRIVKSLGQNAPTEQLDAATKEVLEPDNAVQEQGPAGVYVRQPSQAGEGISGAYPEGRETAGTRQGIEGSVSFLDEARPQGIEQTKALNRAFEEEFDPRLAELGKQREAAIASGDPQALVDWSRDHVQLLKDIRDRDEGFLNAGPREPVAPPDVPKQYLVEAERADRDGKLDDKIAAAEKAGDTGRLSAFQKIKNFIADQSGALKIGEGEKPDLQELLRQSRERSEKATKLVEDAISNGKPKLVLEKDGKSLVLSPGLEGKPYRMTSFDEQGPIGHRDYGENDLRWMADEVSSALNSGYTVRGKTGVLGKLGDAVANLAKDERGSLSWGGEDETNDLQALYERRRQEREKPQRISEPQPLHDLIQSEGGMHYTDDTRGLMEKLAPVGDKDEVVTRNGVKTVLHKADPIEMQVRAERPEITDKAERAALGLGGVDIHEMTRKAIEYGYLPEGSVPDDLVNALQGNQRVYSAKDLDQAHAYHAQQADIEYQNVLKDNRKAIREQFSGENQKVVSLAAKLWADNPNDFSAEDAVRGAKAEISGGPETEGHEGNLTGVPLEGAPVEKKRELTTKQQLKWVEDRRREAAKLWKDEPHKFSETVSLLKQGGDFSRAEVYEAYQAERLAEHPPIVRTVGGAEAKFVETPKGIERVPSPADAKAPVDRPAGTPAIEGPLGRAEAVPPLPPKDSIPPKPSSVLGGGDGGEPPKPPASGGGGGEPPERPRTPIEVTAPKDIDGRLSRFLQNVDFGSLGDTARKIGLYVTTNHHHDEMYGHIMPSQLLYSKATAFKAALSQRMQAHGMARQAELRDFAKRNDAIAKDTMQLERAYQLGINPAKEWGEQSERVREGDNGTYKELHQKYKNIYDRLSKTPGGLDMHNSIREQYETHWTSKPSAVLYTVLNDLADLPEELKAQIVDPSEILINNPDEGIARTPSQANRVFADALDRNLEIAKAHINANPDKFNQILGDLVTEIESQKGKLKDVPYSALVRSGKYGIGFRLAHGLEKGIIDENALAKVQESIKKAGFDNVVIEPLANSDYVFIRSDNSTKINNLKNLLVKHAQAGDIQQKDFEAGSMDVFSKSPAASKTINKLINQIENDDKYKPHEGDSEEMVKAREMRRKQMVSALRELSIDFLPEASMEKYSAHREYIPGFESDPLRAMAKQSIENAQQVSGLLGTYRVQKALAEQLKEWEASKNPLKADGTPNETNQYEPIMAALYGRNMGKEEYAGIKLGGSLWDAAQSLNYSYYLGFNPSFGIIQMSQIPMYVIPELGKKYGFMKAGTAIANSFAPSMKILGAVLEEAKKAGNGALADMPITVEALTKAGLDDETARYMVHMVNRGGIDTGGLARSLGHIAENRTGGKLDKFTRWASAIGYYGETLSRIQTALAAKEVFKNYKNKDGSLRYDLNNPEHWNKLIDESHRVLDEALFDYSQENRATGFSDDPRSLLGRGTKLAFAFQAYWMMAVEKQYREWHKMLTAADPEARKEAAQFILGHLGATALIAGSLGLPGMTVFQRAYENVADDLHPEKGPHDFREEWTKWLEMHLGPTLGDALAYGAPRLVGMDWSKRTGEQDFAPLPTFLFDRGTHKDAFNKWALAKMGPAEGAVANWMASIDKMNAGDTWGAVTGLLPAAGFRNASTTIQAMKEGHYRDSKGHPIPNVDVTGTGIMSGFAGFTPKALAREREDNAMLHRYDTSIELDARNMVAPMVEALRKGDTPAFNRLLPAARKFEKDHPGHDIVERAKTTFQKEYKDREKANKSGMPYERWSKDPLRKTLGLPSLRKQ